MNGLTYVYCVVRQERRPSISRTLTRVGVPGGRGTRALDAGAGLWLIVTTVPAADYSETAIAQGLTDLDWVGTRALAHERVIERFLSAPAVLPMQLFTLFTSDDRALAHVSGQRRDIRAVLRRVARKQEWGLRLTFDGGRRRPRPGAGSGRPQSGTAYLAQQREHRDRAQQQLAVATRQADELFEALTKEAADARRRTAVERAGLGARLLLDAAFLVPVSRTRSFRTAVDRCAREIDHAGVSVSLTGPWPAYNFITAPPRREHRRPAPGSRGGSGR